MLTSSELGFRIPTLFDIMAFLFRLCFFIIYPLAVAISGYIKYKHKKLTDNKNSKSLNVMVALVTSITLFTYLPIIWLIDNIIHQVSQGNWSLLVQTLFSVIFLFTLTRHLYSRFLKQMKKMAHIIVIIYIELLYLSASFTFYPIGLLGLVAALIPIIVIISDVLLDWTLTRPKLFGIVLWGSIVAVVIVVSPRYSAMSKKIAEHLCKQTANSMCYTKEITSCSCMGISNWASSQKMIDDCKGSQRDCSNWCFGITHSCSNTTREEVINSIQEL